MTLLTRSSFAATTRGAEGARSRHEAASMHPPASGLAQYSYEANCPRQEQQVRRTAVKERVRAEVRKRRTARLSKVHPRADARVDLEAEGGKRLNCLRRQCRSDRPCRLVGLTANAR